MCRKHRVGIKQLGSCHIIIASNKLNYLKNPQLLLDLQKRIQTKMLPPRLETHTAEYKELVLTGAETQKWNPPWDLELG